MLIVLVALTQAKQVRFPPEVNAFFTPRAIVSPSLAAGNEQKKKTATELGHRPEVIKIQLEGDL